MTRGGPPYPPVPTTEKIAKRVQKCLDENKELIIAILKMENHKEHAAESRAKLKQNMQYLAEIMDIYPRDPGIPAHVGSKKHSQSFHSIPGGESKQDNEAVTGGDGGLSVRNCFIRGSVVRYVQLPPEGVDVELLHDATRREAWGG